MPTYLVVAALAAIVAPSRAAVPLTDAAFFAELSAAEKAAVAAAQDVKPQGADEALPNELQYVKRSIEYPKTQEEVYKLASLVVLPRLAKEKKPWAIVLDVDETVLDNSPYQVETAKSGKGFEPGTWDAWIKKEGAGAIPGAKDFLAQVRQIIRKQHGRGRIVFITDRDTTQEAATVENLKAAGLFDPATDAILTKDKSKKTPADTKDVRRDCVARGSAGEDARCKAWPPSKIAALFGDSFRDFFEFYGQDAYKTGDAWLEKCVQDGACYVVPNPQYGQWQPQGAAGPYEKFKPKPKPEAPSGLTATPDKKK